MALVSVGDLQLPRALVGGSMTGSLLGAQVAPNLNLNPNPNPNPPSKPA